MTPLCQLFAFIFPHRLLCFSFPQGEWMMMSTSMGIVLVKGCALKVNGEKSGELEFVKSACRECVESV